MTKTLANQLPRINLADGGSMQSVRVVTRNLDNRTLPRLTQNHHCTHGSFVQGQYDRLALESWGKTGSSVFCATVSSPPKPAFQRCFGVFLNLVEAGILSAGLEQLFVRALFDDSRILDYEDDICVPNRGEVMSNYDAGLSLH